MAKKNFYATGNQFVEGQTPTASEWNARTLTLHQAEFDKRDARTVGFYAAPTVTPDDAGKKVDYTADGVNGANGRVQESGYWDFTGKASATYYLYWNTSCVPAVSTSDPGDVLIAGRVGWNGTAFGAVDTAYQTPVIPLPEDIAAAVTHATATGNQHGTEYSELENIPDSFTPAAHASTHATGGDDEITPAAIGAEVAGAAAAAVSAHEGAYDHTLIATALQPGGAELPGAVAAHESTYNHGGLLYNLPPVTSRLDTPPGTPAEGDRYIVIATATGDWAGHEEELTEWDGSAWQFTAGVEGMQIVVTALSQVYVFNGTAWIASAVGSIYDGAFTATPSGTDANDFGITGQAGASTVDLGVGANESSPSAGDARPGRVFLEGAGYGAGDVVSMARDGNELLLHDSARGDVTLSELTRTWRAAADPTVNDDGSDGVQVGDRWVNTSTEAFFKCADATTGAAVWVDEGSGGSVDLSAVLPRNLAINDNFALGWAGAVPFWEADYSTTAPAIAFTTADAGYSSQPVQVTTGENASGLKQTLYGLKPSTTYRLRARVKVDTGDTATLTTTGGSSNVSASSTSTAYEWITGTFATDATPTNVVIHLQGQTSGDVVYCSAVSVTEGTATWPYQPGRQILVRARAADELAIPAVQSPEFEEKSLTNGSISTLKFDASSEEQARQQFAVWPMLDPLQPIYVLAIGFAESAAAGKYIRYKHYWSAAAAGTNIDVAYSSATSPAFDTDDTQGNLDFVGTLIAASTHGWTPNQRLRLLHARDVTVTDNIAGDYLVIDVVLYGVGR